MKYSVGDAVEVRCSKDAIWFDGVIQESDDEHYIVKLNAPQLLSTLHKLKFKRDMKTDTVYVKRHLETIGLGHLHLRLKDPKSLKTK